MSPDSVIAVGMEALKITTMLAAPLLLSALATGLLIGMIQAATQINEMTLSFIPKLLVLVGALFVAGPWMLGLIMSFARQHIQSIPGLIG